MVSFPGFALKILPFAARETGFLALPRGKAEVGFSCRMVAPSIATYSPELCFPREPEIPS
jgi:hypothetical protein